MGQSQRQFERYDVSHSDFFGGYLTESDHHLKLATIGKGGCGFFSSSLNPDLAPPKEIVCSLYTTGKEGYEDSMVLMGNLVYITPKNSQGGGHFYYGVQFFEEDRAKLDKAISRLEELARKGEVQRV